MKKITYGIYNKNGDGVDTVEASSEHEALQKFRKRYGLKDEELSGYWAESIYS